MRVKQLTEKDLERIRQLQQEENRNKNKLATKHLKNFAWLWGVEYS